MPEEVAKIVSKIVIAAAKTVAVYLILEVLTAGLIAAAFSIPLVKLSLPFALFLLPGIFPDGSAVACGGLVGSDRRQMNH